MIEALRSVADWVWLVPALPLLAALTTGTRVLLGQAAGDAGERLTARLTELAALAALLLLVLIDLAVIWHGWPGQKIVGIWFAAAHWQGRISFLLDALSLPVATLTALIGWLVVRFSATYLHRESGFQRYFIVLAMFLGGIQAVLLSGNGLLLFLGWEMCGIASFLLIAHAWQRPVATGNALFAFVTNRAGDAGLLFSLGLAAYWVGSFEWPALFAASLPLVDLRVLVLGFAVAALANSAPLPFTPWIARALEGPPPSSAIFYGSVMVHAGVFLLLRLEPLLFHLPDVLAGLLLIGALTAVYAWLCGLVQTDVKSALIYATVFQVGLMFVAIGLGWTTLATIHLCLHAAWRSWQFLLAPSWLQLTRDRPAPPPAWLVGRQAIYTAALQRLWLDKLGVTLLAGPTTAIARDVRALEESFIDRAIGEPGKGRSIDPERPLVCADGLPGRLLAALSLLLQRIENRLLLRGRGGAAERLLREAGRWLQTLEALLEQPRYLMMAVMATFVVIL